MMDTTTITTTIGCNLVLTASDLGGSGPQVTPDGRLLGTVSCETRLDLAVKNGITTLIVSQQTAVEMNRLIQRRPKTYAGVGAVGVAAMVNALPLVFDGVRVVGR